MSPGKPNINKEEVLLKLSVGIGANINQAQEAVRMAKANKKKDNLYNIETYDNNSNDKNFSIDKEKKLTKGVVRSYIRLEDRLKRHKDEEGLDDLTNFLYDPKTRLLNSIGMLLRSISLKKKMYIQIESSYF